jgi:hypothetical protein
LPLLAAQAAWVVPAALAQPAGLRRQALPAATAVTAAQAVQLMPAAW